MFKDFAFTRSSVRNYSDKDISDEIIKKAIFIAQNAPSACNRQPSRIHIFSNRQDIEGILNLQNGNRGFGHLANKIIVLTTDLNGYHTQKERYMNWIDGGIYLMNLIYSLQFYKIGTCILNWGVEKSKDVALRKLGNISDNESIIAVISCGYYLENKFQVAKSPKRPVTEVLTFH
jgi:nitroreductase